tara:strand:+ start:620 stop:1558 length:939 start_codon:yes stop_codon:yes gene_type:complete
MSNPILALIPSGYKATKVYSVLPNDNSGNFTFARSGDANRVREDGLIETKTSTIARLDWLNSDCPSLLIEPARTNRQIRSEAFNNAAWVKQADITVTQNQVTAPNGELAADKIQRGSTVAANNYISDFITKSSAAALDLTTSVFVKQGEGDFFAFRSQGIYADGRGEAIYQFSTNTLTLSASGQFSVVTSSVENYGNGWYRLSATFNTDAHAQAGTFFSPRATSGQIDQSDTSTSAFVYLWGCQVEEGSSLSSYIKTTSGTVTRNADVCSITTPSGVVKITETFSDDTTNVITSIPGTYTVSEGKIKKVIMI